MTFVRKRGLSHRIAGGHRTLGFDFPGHFRIGYGTRSRLLLLLDTG